MADKWRRKKEPKHVRLYASMTSSEAWRCLSGSATKVLIDLVSIDDGTRNGEIGYSYRHAAERTGLSPNTSREALKELQDKGFIRCTVKGAFSRKVRHASLYRYTWQAASWPDGKSPPTHDFKTWTPSQEKSRHQKLNATAPVFESEQDQSGGTASNIGAEAMEEPQNSVVPCNANIGALIIIPQGDRADGDQITIPTPLNIPPDTGGPETADAIAAPTSQVEMWEIPASAHPACEGCGGDITMHSSNGLKRFCGEPCRKRAERARAAERKKQRKPEDCR